MYILLLLLSLILSSGSARRVTPEECVVIREQGVRTVTKQFGDWYHLTKGLYVGNVCVAHNDQWLDEVGINTVISLSSEWDSLPYKGERTIKFYHFPIPDHKTDDDAFAEELTRQVCFLIHNTIYMGSLPEFSEYEPPRILLHSHLCISTYSKIVRWYKKYFPHRWISTGRVF